jgi:hypothetical protein
MTAVTAGQDLQDFQDEQDFRGALPRKLPPFSELMGARVSGAQQSCSSCKSCNPVNAVSTVEATAAGLTTLAGNW